MGDQVKSRAHRELEGRMVRTAYNQWLFVLLREYLIKPVIKFPFLPLHIARSVAAKARCFGPAMDILLNSGKTVKITRVQSRKSTPVTVKALKRLGSAIGKPSGHPLATEAALFRKLYWGTVGLWLVAVCLFVFGFYEAYREGFYYLWDELRRSYENQDARFIFYGRSDGLMALGIGVLAWMVSLTLSFLLSKRPWLGAEYVIRASLQKMGVLRGEDIASAKVLMVGDYVYINSDTTEAYRVRNATAGWPRGFMPGEIVENTDRPTEMVVINRPTKEPILFGGKNSRADIGSLLKPYEDQIIAKMRPPKSDPCGYENIFLGEVTDSRWWSSSRIYAQLATNPHMVIVGQTRSGKSKSVQSFIYSFARAFPDTIWFFCDGKSSPDYHPFAEYLSEFPMAGMSTNETDKLIELANIIEEVWKIFQQRIRAFNDAQANGVACSTIYEYRKFVGPMPQVWLVIDEFAAFQQEMSFRANMDVSGTLADRIRRLLAESASYGIHILLASQRYQQEDFPPRIRSNLTTNIIHNVQSKDAKFLELEDATQLPKGSYILRASGIFCEYTGLSEMRCKLPYIGDYVTPLIKKTIEPIDKTRKKDFNYNLLYKKGDDELDKIGVPGITKMLRQFFDRQDYICTELMEDLEATELQLEIVKGERRERTLETGQIVSELTPVPGARRFGVALVRPDAVDEEAFLGIQDKAESAGYSAVIVYLLGRKNQLSKLSFVKRLNERGSRLYPMPYREYHKDLRYIENKFRQGEFEDIIRPKLERLGIGGLQHTAAGKNIAIDKIDRKTPVRIKVAKLLDVMGIGSIQEDDYISGVPVIKTKLPGGHRLYVLIGMSKEDRQDIQDIAENLRSQGASVIIVTEHSLLKMDMRRMDNLSVVVWRTVYLDQQVVAFQDSSANARRNLLQSLVKKLGLIDPETGLIRLAEGASLRLNVTPDIHKKRIAQCEVWCAITDQMLYVAKDYELTKHSAAALCLPPGAVVTLNGGFAPLGMNPDLVSLSSDYVDSGAAVVDNTPYQIDRNVLVKKDVSVKNDPVLDLMRKK